MLNESSQSRNLNVTTLCVLVHVHSTIQNTCFPLTKHIVRDVRHLSIVRRFDGIGCREVEHYLDGFGWRFIEFPGENEANNGEEFVGEAEEGDCGTELRLVEVEAVASLFTNLLPHDTRRVERVSEQNGSRNRSCKTPTLCDVTTIK